MGSSPMPGTIFFVILCHKIKSYLSLMLPEFYVISILNTFGFI